MSFNKSSKYHEKEESTSDSDSKALKKLSISSKLSIPEFQTSEEQRLQFKLHSEQLKDYKKKLLRIITDFLDHGSVEDFVDRVESIQMKSDFEQIPKILLSVSFDRNDKERRSSADLIIRLVSTKFITAEHLSKAFSILLSRLSDLILDIPNVVNYLEFYVNRFIDSKSLSYGNSAAYMKLLSIFSGHNPSQTVKKIVEKILKSYFTSGEIEECVREISEFNDLSLHPLIVKYSVSLSLDRTNREREMVSLLFARVVDDHIESTFINRKNLEEGFLILLNCASDLYEDVPYVHEYLSNFIARAAYDDSLAPSFLKNARSKVDSDGNRILYRAEQLLSYSLGSNELITIWGQNLEDIDLLKREVSIHVKSFFDNGDADAFRHFLVELNRPHFHYDVIYSLFSLLLDRGKDFIEPTGDLIGSLYKLGITTEDEMIKGFSKALARMPDLVIDVPNAPQVYASLRERVLKGKELSSKK